MAGIRRVAVVTESVASLPEYEAESLGITVIPIPFEYAGRSYQDGVDITPEEFNRMLSTSLPAAITSAPSPGAYAEQFAWLNGKGYDVLCVSPTPSVTRMMDAAEQGRLLARERDTDTRIKVLDSGAAAMAQGFVVRAAARLALEGAGIEEVAGGAAVLSERVSMLVTLDTLEYLAKTSRIPRISSLLGQALQIKPVILFERGEVRPLERPRTRRRSIARLLELMDERVKDGASLHAAVQHAAAHEDARTLEDEVRERFDPAEVLISEFSPVMSSYTGPGLLGVAFYEDAGVS